LPHFDWKNVLLHVKLWRYLFFSNRGFQ